MRIAETPGIVGAIREPGAAMMVKSMSRIRQGIDGEGFTGSGLSHLY